MKRGQAFDSSILRRPTLGSGLQFCNSHSALQDLAHELGRYERE